MRVYVPILLLVGAVLLVLLFGQHGVAQSPQASHLSLAPQGDGNGVWVLDMKARRIKICLTPLHINAAPDCTEWGPLD